MADAASFQPSGREVRCTRCGESWYQDPPADLPLKALPNYAGTAPLAAPAPARSRLAAHAQLFRRLAEWAVLGGVTASLALGAYLFRAEIVRLWPESASLYAVLGTPVNALGLEFRNASFEEEASDGVRALVVMGEIVNTSDAAALIPNLRISLRDGKRREIFDWTTDPPVARLDAGATQSFVARLTSPPQNAQDLVIRFAERRPVATN